MKQQTNLTGNTTPPISPNLFNTHFLTLAETLAQSSGCTTDNFVCSTLLSNLCGKKLKPDDNFSIPPMTVLDVGKCISTMPNNKSTGRDNISPFLLKLALPYIVEPLTYIYDLSIQKKCVCNYSQESKGNSSKGQRFKQTKQLSPHIHTPVTFKTD